MELTEEVYTIAEVARLMRLSKATVYRYIHDGTLDAFRFGRTWRVRRGTVAALLDQADTA
jgi:excisionase family DNA binding protein